MASLILPPAEILAAAAATLVENASGDASAERAINKALWQLDNGIEIRSTVGGFLMPSGTRAGIIHRVTNLHGCTCEAARSGKACWHASALAILEEAQRHTMPRLVRQPSPSYARALADMDELFA